MAETEAGETAASARVPWWGVIGWSVVLFVLVVRVLAGLNSSQVVGREEQPFLLPWMWLAVIVGAALGIAGLVVRELKNRN